jgi:hypothetical protein
MRELLLATTTVLASAICDGTVTMLRIHRSASL